MDVKTIFRNLVTNQYMDNFDYGGTEFSFRTVFHMDTIFSYCMCTCAFEHEFVDYITEAGTVDEENYEKIVKCIIDGHCPHVSQVPENFVKETSISGIHIASVVGTIDALDHNLSSLQNRHKHGSLYHVDPYALALLRNNKDERAVSVMRRHYAKENRYEMKLITADKIYGDKSSISFMATDVIDVLEKSKNLSLLEDYVITDDYASFRTDDVNLYRIGVLYNLDYIQLTVMDGFLYQLDCTPLDEFLRCLFQFQIWVLYYDRATLLGNHLAFLSKNVTTEYLKKLNYMCQVFKSAECQNVLQNHGYNRKEHQNLDTKDQVKTLLDALVMAPSMLKETVKEALTEISDLRSAITAAAQDGDKWNYLFAYNRSFMDMKDPEVLKIILDCGIHVDKTDSIGATPLIDIMKKFIRYYPFTNKTTEILAIRQNVELYLFENVDVNLNEMAMTLADKIDRLLHGMNMDQLTKNRNFRFLGMCLMNACEHSIFGHDHKHNFALNFMMPILLECGFRMKGLSLLELHGTELHPVEKEYLHSFISMPRSLKSFCRNSLRQHYKGRQVHCFVKQSNIPNSIADYILLRPLLQAVPKRLLM